jgi:hypothetical protein
VRAVGHFLPAVKINGRWWVYDSNREIDSRRYPLDWLMRADPRISKIYQPLVAELLLSSARTKQIRLTDVNTNPAKQASLLHETLAVLSNVGWLITLLLWAVVRPSSASGGHRPRNLHSGPERLFSVYSLCPILGHRRERRSITLHSGTWRSRCRHCDASLIRLRQGRWIRLADLQEHAVLLLGPAFDLAWPVAGSREFNELLIRVDEADRRRSALSMHRLRLLAPRVVAHPTYLEPSKDSDREVERQAA